MRKNKTLRRKKEYIKALRQKKKWMTVVTCLACVVVFCTVYALILPAITLEGETHCGRTEHTHSEECYAPVLAYALEGDENHTHTDECYESVVSCGIEEHTHTDTCYINNTDDSGDEDDSGDG